MLPCRVSLVFNLADQGWTENFYILADNARAASNLGPRETLWPLLAFRPYVVELLAVRAEELVGSRRVFLRIYPDVRGLFGGNPDVTSTAVRMEGNFLGGSYRSLWLRGIGDSLIARDQLGNDILTAQLANMLADLRAWYLARGFAGQVLEGESTNPWQDVLNLYPDAVNLEWTRVKTFPGFAPQFGDVVYFGGCQRYEVTNEKPYWVMDGIDSDGAFAIAFKYPRNVRIEIPGYPFKVRFRRYNYPTVRDWAWREYPIYRTGPPYFVLSWAPDNPFQLPQNPCGRPVDVGRRPSRVYFRPFRDDPGAMIRATWYKVKKRDGKYPDPIPFPHLFASQFWNLGTEPEPLVGEVYGKRQNYTGPRPVELLGQGYCGSEQQWSNGALTTDPMRPVNPTTGSPCCCGAGVMLLPAGGAGGLTVVSRALAVEDLGGAAGPGALAAALAVEDLGGAAGPGALAAALAVEDLGGAAGPTFTQVPPYPESDECSYYPWIPGAWKVTITGATGELGIWNGEWTVPHISGCSAQYDLPDTAFALSVDLALGGQINCQFFAETTQAHYNDSPAGLPFGTFIVPVDFNPTGDGPPTVTVESL